MEITLKVAALIKNKEHHTLLIKEQYTEDQGYKWNLVKGTYDNSNETIEECVIREIREEVGLTTIANVVLSKVYHYGKPENPKILFVFTAEYTGAEEATTDNKNDDEIISETKWFSSEELMQITKEECIAEYVYNSINSSKEDVTIERL